MAALNVALRRYVKKAVINRRKMLAEGLRLRAYLNEVQSEGQRQYIAVAGDFNDGPGSTSHHPFPVPLFFPDCMLHAGQ